MDGFDPDALTAAELAQLPHYVWSGPDDERTCTPCRKQFGDPIVAFTLSDLPAPQDVCTYGRACRHFWVLIE